MLCYFCAPPYPSHQIRALCCVLDLPDSGPKACLLAVHWHVLNLSLREMAFVIRVSLPAV